MHATASVSTSDDRGAFQYAAEPWIAKLGLAPSAQRLQAATAILFDDLRRFDHEPIVRGEPASEERLQALGDLLRSIGLLRSRYSAAAGSRNLDGVELRHRLSRREIDVLQQLLAGLAEKQIALHLRLSRHTVHEHVKQIYRRMLVSSRAELMSRFVNEELTPADRQVFAAMRLRASA